MQDRRGELSDTQFDVLVIGAGIFGACLAWEASRRGYKVAVIDKGDFGAATSSNHFRFIHGGIRYLQHLDIVRVRESSEERSALIRLAPHLCYPMPIILPTYGHGKRGKGLLRAAMAVYDLLTLDRNRGIPDPSRRTPRGTVLSREEVLRLFPGTPAEGLTGAAKFHDGQMYNPARLVLAFLQSAADDGAVVANYVQADRLLREGDAIVGCAATDRLSGDTLEIRARMVVNAAGPWGHRLLAGDTGVAIDPPPSFSRDLAFVVRKSVSPAGALGCQTASGDADAVLDRGARHLFLVPWRGMTLVGVWHGYTEMHPEGVAVSREELQAYLDEINGAYRGLDLRMEDIGIVNTGLILFGAKEQQAPGGKHSFSHRALFFDHAREQGVQGLLTIVGDRATVARRVAAKAINVVDVRLRGGKAAAGGEPGPVHGGAFDTFARLIEEVRGQLPPESQSAARAVAHNYGAAYRDVLACADGPEDLLTIGESNVLAVEVRHAARSEMAKSLEDIVVRRTELGSGGDPGETALATAAALAARELGWSDDAAADQLAHMREYFRARGPWRLVERTNQLGANLQ
jgi:glycerol-3-phosphate dehydrogenase